MSLWRGRGCVRWMFQENVSEGEAEQGLRASGGHRESYGKGGKEM